ncbi:MAG: hypothetical protein KAF91_08420 [Nostoc sp. TH1S01]|nr:hypothetical protein [Nostoc sp. TH1S01]
MPAPLRVALTPVRRFDAGSVARSDNSSTENTRSRSHDSIKCPRAECASNCIGSQKLMPQVGSRGGRISILGLWEPQVSFEYALVQGRFKTQRYIEVMDWVAAKAQQTLDETGRITVVVQDNGSLHKSNKAKQRWQQWLEQGLYLFFLPPYSK